MALKRARLSHTLETVGDGEQAINYLAGADKFVDRSLYPVPEVLITDLKMPRKNGFDVLEWVRSKGSYGKLPVVVLSSSDEKRDMDRAFALGATNYFLKTVDFGNVIQYLRDLNHPSP